MQWLEDDELRRWADDATDAPRRWASDIIKVYRKKIQVLRSATDERDLDARSQEGLAEELTVDFAARRNNPDEAKSVVQRAWVACVKTSARDLEVAELSHDLLRELAAQLPERARNPEEFAAFQASFADVGVKLVYGEAFPSGKLDGCALVVDNTPVIGVSGRWKTTLVRDAPNVTEQLERWATVD